MRCQANIKVCFPNFLFLVLIYKEVVVFQQPGCDLIEQLVVKMTPIFHVYVFHLEV